MAVASPKLHVGRLAVEDITERCVTGVARTREHSEVAVDLLREQYAVTVVRQECVLELMECLEVLCPSDADSRSVVAVAPCYIVAVLDEANARVVAVYPLADLLVVALEAERLLIDVPVHTVFRETYVEHHAAVGVVATEYTCEALTERNYCTVEDTS